MTNYLQLCHWPLRKLLHVLERPFTRLECHNFSLFGLYFLNLKRKSLIIAGLCCLSDEYEAKAKAKANMFRGIGA